MSKFDPYTQQIYDMKIYVYVYDILPLSMTQTISKLTSLVSKNEVAMTSSRYSFMLFCIYWSTSQRFVVNQEVLCIINAGRMRMRVTVLSLSVRVCA